MRPDRRTILRRMLMAGLAPVLPATGAAAEPTTAASGFPSRPITLVVPFGAGSATDQLARALAASLASQTGKPVIVDNRAGADGIIGAQLAARAPADGHTVLVTTNTTQAANPWMHRKLPYDPLADFVPLTALGRGGTILVVRAQSPHRSVDDLLAAARRDPGKLSFGSGNSSSRMAGELLKQMTRTDITWVGYKSNPGGLTDLLGGQIEMMMIDTITGLPQIRAGKLRALGVSTASRMSQLPDVPTLAETGVRGYDIGYWFAAYLPAGAPAPIAGRLRELLLQAALGSEAEAFYRSTGTERWTTTAEELSAFQAAELRKWGRVIKAAGIEAE